MALMKSVAQLKIDLNLEERNLLFDGYNKVIDSLRTAWRKISYIELQEYSREMQMLL